MPVAGDVRKQRGVRDMLSISPGLSDDDVESVARVLREALVSVTGQQWQVSPVQCLYEPHPIDTLIFLALEEGGAMTMIGLLAELAEDTYSSRGKDRTVTASALKRRLPELVRAEMLVKTSAGYAVAQGCKGAFAAGSNGN